MKQNDIRTRVRHFYLAMVTNQHEINNFLLCSKPMLNQLRIIIKLLLDFSVEPVLQNYITITLIVKCSDGSGNNTGYFLGDLKVNSLVVH